MYRNTAVLTKKRHISTQALKDALSQPLPGQEAQYEMAHQFRYQRSTLPGPQSKRAGVLVLLYPKYDETHLVLIKRKSHDRRDVHRGQISLPGGKEEVHDQNISHTALREAHEEVGAPLEGVEILGALTDLFIPVSDFHVFPFVGYWHGTGSFTRQEAEVDEIFEVPLAHFMAPDTLRTTNLRIREGIVLKEVPYFNVQGEIVWGATAMILNEFLHVVRRFN